MTTTYFVLTFVNLWHKKFTQVALTTTSKETDRRKRTSSRSAKKSLVSSSTGRK
ncbi:unnamed protein product [Meloidogyne enterolobii]|uniref:Uncharacterized protein n=1 Tax=Meloidogyne enterolobii TaxID=390850 RepID=A0ACB0YCR0_MELEN